MVAADRGATLFPATRVLPVAVVDAIAWRDSARLTSGLGQTEKNSVRANVFRFALELGHCSTQSACLKVPGADIPSKLNS